MTVSEQLRTYPSLNNHNINLNLSSVDYYKVRGGVGVQFLKY